MIYLDDTGRCPVADACVTCGAAEDLAVATVGTQVGVYCTTVCRPCRAGGRVGAVAVAAVVGLVLAHCGHLGIDADRMAALLEAEGDR